MVARAAALVLIGGGCAPTGPMRELTDEERCQSTGNARVERDSIGRFVDCCFRYPPEPGEYCCLANRDILVSVRGDGNTLSCATPGPFVPPSLPA